MKTLKKIPFKYVVITMVGLSLGATYATRRMLEIGPVATITNTLPELDFVDTTAGDPGFEIESNGQFLNFDTLGGINNIFRINSGGDANNLVIDTNGNVALNRDTAQIFNEFEVFGNNGAGDTFAAMAITPDPTGNRSSRLTVSTATNVANLGVRNAGGYTNPVAIDLSSPNNSLSIASDGDVGLGVSKDLIASGIDLHVNGGQVLLDNVSSDWRLNPGGIGLWFGDTNSGVFQINNNAPSSSLVIEGTTGHVGIGTGSPTAPLEIRKTDGSARFVVEESNATVDIRELFELRNNGGVRFALDNLAIGERWDFTNGSTGTFFISRFGSGGPELQLGLDGRLITGPGGFAALDSRPNGNLFIQGSLFELSDRTKKEDFQDVDLNDVLNKIDALPITTWKYKSDAENIRHMGPVAQDFRSAFGLGDSDTTIAACDKSGVTLAAIKALSAKVKEKDARIGELESELDIMNQRLERLEAALQSMHSPE